MGKPELSERKWFAKFIGGMTRRETGGTCPLAQSWWTGYPWLGIYSPSLYVCEANTYFTSIDVSPFTCKLLVQEWTLTFISFCLWQRSCKNWRNSWTLFQNCQWTSWHLESEETDQPWSLWEGSPLAFWDWPLLSLCFAFKGSTPASGQDLLRRHGDCCTLEWLHGGGCGGRGESSPRGKAWGHGLWGRKQLMGLTNRLNMSEILEANSPWTPIWRTVKHLFNSSHRWNEHLNQKVTMSPR